MSTVPQTPAPTAPGRLVLVPNTLDLGAVPEPIEQVLSTGVLRRAAGLQYWAVENAKTTRAFLKRVGEVLPLAQPLQALDIRELPRPRKGGAEKLSTAAAQAQASAEAQAWRALLAPALAGHDVGLLSEAGLPAVADPGATLVHMAHSLGVVVEPLPGPSSLTLGLAASGLNGQRFAFEGYLPQEASARAKRVRELELRSRQEQQTQLVIETPYRNSALLGALLQLLQPGTQLSVACGLTSAEGWCRTQRVSDWRRLSEAQRQLPDKLPAVFMWLAS
jgi:16S rRNA (cytidine1402-2'-O)-methyltransferase